MMRGVRSPRALLLAAAATALIAGGAGCGGGGENEEYADEIQGVVEPLDSELREIGDTVTGSRSIEEVAKAVNAFEAEIAETVNELEAIDPPPDVEQAHELLIGAFAAFNRAVMRLSQAAESGSATAIIATAEQLQAATRRLRTQLGETEQRLQDAGIEVGE